MAPPNYPAEILKALGALNIPLERISARALAVHPEARSLVVAAREGNDREHLLAPAAAVAWAKMSYAASGDGIEVRIVSAFRSIERQAEIVGRKLESGLGLAAILAVNAPPGFSEHHTGRAVDITTAGCPPLDVAFSHTEAFRWLTDNAHRFSFALSYPEGNSDGYAYEPWHWCFQGGGD